MHSIHYISPTTGEECRHQHFEEFVTQRFPQGLGTKLHVLKNLCRDNQLALDWIDQVCQRPAGRPKETFDNVKDKAPTGNAREAGLRRLRKDRPDLHAEVIEGKRSVHAAMIEAGFRKRLEPVEVIKRTWKKLRAEGKSTREIAKAVGVSHQTAKREMGTVTNVTLPIDPVEAVNHLCESNSVDLPDGMKEKMADAVASVQENANATKPPPPSKRLSKQPLGVSLESISQPRAKGSKCKRATNQESSSYFWDSSHRDVVSTLPVIVVIAQCDLARAIGIIGHGQRQDVVEIDLKFIADHINTDNVISFTASNDAWGLVTNGFSYDAILNDMKVKAIARPKYIVAVRSEAVATGYEQDSVFIVCTAKPDSAIADCVEFHFNTEISQHVWQRTVSDRSVEDNRRCVVMPILDVPSADFISPQWRGSVVEVVVEDYLSGSGRRKEQVETASDRQYQCTRHNAGSFITTGFLVTD